MTTGKNKCLDELVPNIQCDVIICIVKFQLIHRPLPTMYDTIFFFLQITVKDEKSGESISCIIIAQKNP